jgi:hypothetical protein
MAKLAGPPPPTFDASHFTCPHCGVDAQMHWLQAEIPRGHLDHALKRSQCLNCEGRSYWINGELVWPPLRLGAPAPGDLEGDHLNLYEEARAVAAHSPRAAAALLRLLVENLVKELDPDARKGMKLHDRIERLAERKMITATTLDALHTVKWGGNDGIHDGQVDPDGKDDLPVVLFLFEIVNRIVEDTMAMPRRLGEFKAQREAARATGGKQGGEPPK